MKIPLPYVVIAAVAVISVAALAIPIIEQGLAYRGSTYNEEDLGASLYIKATEAYGEELCIPPVTYLWSEERGTYVLANPSKTVYGNMHVQTPHDQDVSLSTIIDFQNRGSWIFIETIKVEVDEHEYTVYDSSLDNISAQRKSLGSISTGDYDFQIIVNYKETVNLDPKQYHDGNMKSNISFIVDNSSYSVSLAAVSGVRYFIDDTEMSGSVVLHEGEHTIVAKDAQGDIIEGVTFTGIHVYDGDYFRLAELNGSGHVITSYTVTAVVS